MKVGWGGGGVSASFYGEGKGDIPLKILYI